MKSLSNLLKKGFLTVTNHEPRTRIIDTNELVAAKIEALLEAEKEMTLDDGEDGFISGLEAEKVEMLLDDQDKIVVKSQEELQEEAEMLLENARLEAAEILHNADEKAETVRKAAFEQGQKQGYEDGYHRAVAEAEIMKQNLLEEQKNLELDYHQKLEELEPMLLDKILEVLDDTLAIDLKDNQTTLLYLLKKNLGQIENSGNYIIRIAKEDMEIMQLNRDFLMTGLTPDTRLEFLEDGTLSKGQCRLETDGGIFDCSLDTQLAALKKELQILAGSRNG